MLPPAPSTNPYPYGKSKIFKPTSSNDAIYAPSAGGAISGATEAAAALVRATPRSVISAAGAVNARALAPQRSGGAGGGVPASPAPDRLLSVGTPASTPNPLVELDPGLLAFRGACGTSISVARSPRALELSELPQADDEPMQTGAANDDADVDVDAADCGAGIGAAHAQPARPSRTPSAATQPTPATRPMPSTRDGLSTRPASLSVVADARPQPRKGAPTQATMDELARAPPPGADEQDGEPHLNGDAPTGRSEPARAAAAGPGGGEAGGHQQQLGAGAAAAADHPLGADISTRPSLEELRRKSPDELKSVDKFEVKRVGYGAVQWLEPVDLSGGVLDELAKLVRFSEREVQVYPSGVAKPPRGEGLNKKAQVTMERIWPRDRSTLQDLRDARSVQAFRKKLQEHANRIGARMLGYDGELGQWRFQVEQF